jgi:hypothetical protein
MVGGLRAFVAFGYFLGGNSCCKGESGNVQNAIQISSKRGNGLRLSHLWKIETFLRFLSQNGWSLACLQRPKKLVMFDRF